MAFGDPCCETFLEMTDEDVKSHANDTMKQRVSQQKIVCFNKVYLIQYFW